MDRGLPCLLALTAELVVHAAITVGRMKEFFDPNHSKWSFILWLSDQIAVYVAWNLGVSEPGQCSVRDEGTIRYDGLEDIRPRAVAGYQRTGTDHPEAEMRVRENL